MAGVSVYYYFLLKLSVLMKCEGTRDRIVEGTIQRVEACEGRDYKILYRGE